MRLLTPTQAKKIREQEDEKHSQKVSRIETLLFRLEEQYRARKESLESDVALAQAEYTSLANELSKRLDTIRQEIQTKEKDRDELLFPVHEQQLKLQEKVNELAAWEQNILSEKKELDATREQTKRDAERSIGLVKCLDRREQIIKDKEFILKVRENNIKTQEQGLTGSIDAVQKDRNEVENKAKAIRDREDDLNQIEHMLNVRKEELDRREGELRGQSEHIASQQRSLRAAFEEARKKKII